LGQLKKEIAKKKKPRSREFQFKNINYTLTKTINQTNEHLTNYQGGNTFYSENYSPAKTNLKTKSRR
jgi:hypothetical protein